MPINHVRYRAVGPSWTSSGLQKDDEIHKAFEAYFEAFEAIHGAGQGSLPLGRRTQCRMFLMFLSVFGTSGHAFMLN